LSELDSDEAAASEGTRGLPVGPGRPRQHGRAGEPDSESDGLRPGTSSRLLPLPPPGQIHHGHYDE
jgi:hypothetical protein